MKLAVLTGDIVGSSEMTSDALDAVIGLVESLSVELAGWRLPEGTATAPPPGSGFARRGGDGWQIALPCPGFALRATLYVQARLMALDPPAQSRIAAATGAGHLPDNPDDDLNSAHGAVFNASGRLLDRLKGHHLIAHAGGGALDAAFRLADHIAQGWTRVQAQTVALMLPPGAGPRRVAAEQLGVSRQSVDQALWAAGFPAISDALGLIEA